MSRSLSLILSVCNAEQDLAEKLQELLELLADFTERFEVLLVDQGSTDQTIEVARELARHYPQVRVVDQDFRRQSGGLEATLAQTTGELVFVQTGHTAVRPSALRKLWDIGADEVRQEQTASRPRRRWPGQLPVRVPALSAEATSQVGELRLIRRG